MSRISRVSFLAAVLLAAGSAGAAFATEAPRSGLGQAWPNAPDVSASPHWHVYVFMRDGVRYVQVNDLNGGIHGAIATAGGTVLVLPVGSDAQNVVENDGTAPPAAGAETVYTDSTVRITAAMQPTGAVQLNVQAPCTDPVECSTHVVPSNP